MLYVCLLWPCLLLTLGYLSSFFLAERKLRWPSLPLLLSPLTPQLICTQVATESLFFYWSTSLPPRSQLIVIRTAGPTHRGLSSAFLCRSSVTTFCHLHGFCKGFWVMTKWRQGKKRSLHRMNRTYSFRPETRNWMCLGCLCKTSIPLCSNIQKEDMNSNDRFFSHASAYVGPAGHKREESDRRT